MACTLTFCTAESESETMADDGSRSEFSLSPRSPDHQPDASHSEELLSSLDEQIDEVLHIDDGNNEINRLITDAQQQGFNCLDLSKKQLAEFPSLLLKFPLLQVNSPPHLTLVYSSRSVSLLRRQSNSNTTRRSLPSIT